jgi:Peptidase M50B-like
MRILTTIFLIPLMFFYSMGVLHVLDKFSLTPYNQFYFWIFMLLSFIINYVFRKQTSFWSIFKHEFTHNIFAIFTLNKPSSFSVQKGEGGVFEYSGRNNFIITLSPYFYPTISSFVLLISIFDLKFKILFYIILGVAAGFDLSSSIKDMHLHQPDLRKYGLLFSILAVSFGIIFFWGILFSFVIGGWDLTIEFIKFGVIKIIDITKELISNHPIHW